MVELIKIEQYDNNECVDARELHAFLNVGKDFTTWIKDRIEKYDFQEKLDFSPFLGKTSNGRPRTEYKLSLSMAKELAMLENNEQGKRARRYFIEVERMAKSSFGNDSIGTSYQLEVQDLAREAADVMGGQNRLAEYLGISSATLTAFHKGTWRALSNEMIKAIEFNCRRLLAYGIEQELRNELNYMHIVNKVRDHRVRLELTAWFDASKKGGL